MDMLFTARFQWRSFKRGFMPLVGTAKKMEMGIPLLGVV
jgi:hypothetical protein